MRGVSSASAALTSCSTSTAGWSPAAASAVASWPALAGSVPAMIAAAAALADHPSSIKCRIDRSLRSAVSS
jgi:hypothetical protein